MRGPSSVRPVAAVVFQALGDPRRIAVLMMVLSGPVAMVDLIERFGLMTATNLLHPLRRADLVSRQKYRGPIQATRNVRLDGDGNLVISAEDLEIVIRQKSDVAKVSP